MKKNFVLILGLCISLCAFSQLPVWHGDFAFSGDSVKPTDYISFVSEYTNNSNAISNQFLNQLDNSFFITSEDKERELLNAGETIRLGLVFDAGLWYKHRLKKNNLTLVFNLRSRSFRTIEVSREVLNLILNGNTQNEGKTIDFSPTKMSHYIHQEVYLGAEKMFDSIGLLVGGGVAIQKLAYHRELELTGSVYTAPYGQYIDYDIHYTDQETRSLSENNFKRNEGFGVTINAYAEKQFNNKSRLAVDIKDIGFINVGDVREYKLDETMRWEGVYVDDVNGTPTIIGELPSPEITESRKSKKLTTTGSVNMSYFKKVSPKFYGYVGVKQFFTSAYTPRIYTRPYYKFCKCLSVGMPMAYGGFGKFDIGVSLKGNIFKNYYYTVDVNYLESLLNPKNSSGQGINFALSAMF